MVGLALLSVGVVLLVFAFHQLGYLPIRQKTTVLTNSPISPTEHLPVSGKIIPEPEEVNIRLILVVGLAMVVAGGIIAILHREK